MVLRQRGTKTLKGRRDGKNVTSAGEVSGSKPAMWLRAPFAEVEAEVESEVSPGDAS